jgi:hypothetical protein
VLTQEQIEQFRTLGFVVVPGALTGFALAHLTEEVDAAIAAAGPRTFGGGIEGHYVPAAKRPVSAGLVRRFHPLAEQLLGREAFPVSPFEILFFGEAGWHDDIGPDADALKLAIYLERLHAGNGALRVRPFDRATELVLETEPGDLIAFHLKLFHASFKGRDRRQWSVEYFAWPREERERGELRRLRQEWLEEPEWGPAYTADVERLKEEGVL